MTPFSLRRADATWLVAKPLNHKGHEGIQKKAGKSKAKTFDAAEGEFSAMTVQIAIIANIAKESKLSASAGLQILAVFGNFGISGNSLHTG